MDEQKTLTLDFIKSLMEPAYTLIWTDYNDNLDNHCGLIQKCLDSKSREHLWEKVLPILRIVTVLYILIPLRGH